MLQKVYARRQEIKWKTKRSGNSPKSLFFNNLYYYKFSARNSTNEANFPLLRGCLRKLQFVSKYIICSLANYCTLKEKLEIFCPNKLSRVFNWRYLSISVSLSLSFFRILFHGRLLRNILNLRALFLFLLHTNKKRMCLFVPTLHNFPKVDL